MSLTLNRGANYLRKQPVVESVVKCSVTSRRSSTSCFNDGHHSVNKVCWKGSSCHSCNFFGKFLHLIYKWLCSAYM
jgi:hypothetical protein